MRKSFSRSQMRIKPAHIIPCKRKHSKVLNSFLPSFLPPFLPSFLPPFLPSFLPAFLPSFLPSSIVCSFVRSLIRLFARSSLRFVCSSVRSVGCSCVRAQAFLSSLVGSTALLRVALRRVVLCSVAVLCCVLLCCVSLNGNLNLHVYAYGVKTAPVVIAIFTFRTVALAHMVDASCCTCTQGGVG